MEGKASLSFEGRDKQEQKKAFAGESGVDTVQKLNHSEAGQGAAKQDIDNYPLTIFMASKGAHKKVAPIKTTMAIDKREVLLERHIPSRPEVLANQSLD